MKEYFKEVEGQWSFATSLDTSKMEEVQEFLEESVKGRLSRNIVNIVLKIIYSKLLKEICVICKSYQYEDPQHISLVCPICNCTRNT